MYPWLITNPRDKEIAEGAQVRSKNPAFQEGSLISGEQIKAWNRFLLLWGIQFINNNSRNVKIFCILFKKHSQGNEVLKGLEACGF